MHCPHCNSPLPTADAAACPVCGKTLSASASSIYDSLTLEIEQLRHIQSDAVARLDAMSASVQDLRIIMGPPLTEPPQPRPIEQQEIRAETIVSVPRPEIQTPSPAPATETPSLAAPSAAATFTFDTPQKAESPASARQSVDSLAFETKLGQKWLLGIGLIVMIFGVGYFLKYSFDQGWVGPAGRVSMAYAWGLAFLAGGEIFRRRGFSRYGLWIAGGGISVLYFASYAASQIYELIPQATAFGVMILTTALAIALALSYDTMGLAVLGILGGFLTPAMLSTGATDRITLYSYLLLLDVGVLAVAFKKRWGVLSRIALVATWILVASSYSPHSLAESFWPALFLFQGFLLVFTLVPFVGDMRNIDTGSFSNAYLPVPGAMLSFGASYLLIKHVHGQDWCGLLSLGYSLLFLALATSLYRRHRDDLISFPVMLFNAALYLAITAPILLSRGVVTSFWAFMALGLLWVGLHLKRRSTMAWATALMGLALCKLVLYDYPLAWNLRKLTHFAHGFEATWVERYTCLAAITLVLWGVIRLTGKTTLEDPATEKLRQDILQASATCFAILVFAVSSVEVSAWFWDYMPRARAMAYSVLWALYAVGLMITGFRLRLHVARMAALSLFAITLGKVFLVDMAQVSTPYRIVSFIFLGLLLVGSSFLYYRFKDRLQSALPIPDASGHRTTSPANKSPWQSLEDKS